MAEHSWGGAELIEGGAARSWCGCGWSIRTSVGIQADESDRGRQQAKDLALTRVQDGLNDHLRRHSLDAGDSGTTL